MHKNIYMCRSFLPVLFMLLKSLSQFLTNIISKVSHIEIVWTNFTEGSKLYVMYQYVKCLFYVYSSLRARATMERRRRANLVGHAYSWGINTHKAMLLLENTRS